jgi:PKD repeat protein
MNTRLIIIFVIFKMLAITHICGQQQVVAKFTTTQNCDYLVEFENTSVSAVANDTIYYLWRFYDLGMTVESPVENPVMSYPNPGYYNVTLIAWNPDGAKDQFDTTIYVEPSVFMSGIVSDDFLVCSNTPQTTYSIETASADSLDFTFLWTLSDMNFVKEITGETTREVMISWDEINASPPMPVQLDITCETTSSEGCTSKTSEQILLIPESIPTDQNYSLIRKPSNNEPSNILLCLINNSHLYSYRWGFSGLGNSWDTLTTKPYYHFNEIDNNNTYWVEILNRDYSFCSVITELEPESKQFNNPSNQHPQIEIYPNPCNDFTYIKFSESSVAKTHITILDVSGQILRHEILPAANAGVPFRLKTDYLQPGVYVLKIQQANQVSTTSKIIINE